MNFTMFHCCVFIAVTTVVMIGTLPVKVDAKKVTKGGAYKGGTKGGKGGKAAKAKGKRGGARGNYGGTAGCFQRNWNYKPTGYRYQGMGWKCGKVGHKALECGSNDKKVNEVVCQCGVVHTPNTALSSKLLAPSLRASVRGILH